MCAFLYGFVWVLAFPVQKKKLAILLELEQIQLQNSQSNAS